VRVLLPKSKTLSCGSDGELGPSVSTVATLTRSFLPLSSLRYGPHASKRSPDIPIPQRERSEVVS